MRNQEEMQTLETNPQDTQLLELLDRIYRALIKVPMELTDKNVHPDGKKQIMIKTTTTTNKNSRAEKLTKN